MGEVIAFIDSDCIIAPDYLSKAWKVIRMSPNRGAFQGRIVGSNRSMVSRIEHARVGGVTASKTQADGTVAYANTSGFFIRRDVFESMQGFDETVKRGEDSLLLGGLMANDDAPLLLEGATLEHRPRMPVSTYILKHFTIGRETARGRMELDRVDAGLLGHAGRVRTIVEMRRLAREHSSSTVTLALAILCYLVECGGRAAAAIPGRRVQAHDRKTG